MCNVTIAIVLFCVLFVVFLDRANEKSYMCTQPLLLGVDCRASEHVPVTCRGTTPMRCPCKRVVELVLCAATGASRRRCGCMVLSACYFRC